METTTLLREAVAASVDPSRVWFNASRATIYRHAEDRPMTEATGELGSGFSVDVARAWQRAFEGTRPQRVAWRSASRSVVPERLGQAGYSFIHPELEPALRSIL